jgi:hypothetical protein
VELNAALRYCVSRCVKVPTTISSARIPMYLLRMDD